MSLWGEIRRRNVHRVVIAYVAAAWLLIQVVETLFPVFGLSDAAIRVVVIVLAIGFVPAVILSWIFEWTPEGLRRDSDVAVAAPAEGTRRFDATIIATLVLAVAYFAVDKFVFDPARDTAREAQVAAQARGDAIRQKYGENSIAVLAFEDISEAGDLGYFADGIAEELLNLLAKIPEMRVAGRTSAFSFKDKTATLPEIGDALGVTYIVEGSVRTAADRIRITVQLVEAASDTHLFSQNYDREFDNIFEIQDEVAAKVVDELHVSLLGDVPHAKRVNPRAYALYLQARAIENDGNPTLEKEARARQMLERALEIDPNYGDALSAYAGNLYAGGEEMVPSEQTIARIRRMMNRVLAIDPNNANALSWMSWLSLTEDKDIETAARYKKRAHEADPTNYEVLTSSASTLAFFGRPELALSIGNYILDREPLCLSCYYSVAVRYAQLGDYASAKARLRDAIALAPENRWSKAQLGAMHVFAGEHEEALDVFETLRDEAGQCCMPGHLEALHDLGRLEEFEALLPQHIENHENMGVPLIIAQLYAWIGDADEAFRWIEKSRPFNQYAIRSHLTRPWYRKMHEDPRWQALLEQYQMTEEHFASVDLDIRLPPGVEP
jgi:TolB-like protein/thioredoxin-like negative regulator of GroEL